MVVFEYDEGGEGGVCENSKTAASRLAVVKMHRVACSRLSRVFE